MVAGFFILVKRGAVQKPVKRQVRWCADGYSLCTIKTAAVYNTAKKDEQQGKHRYYYA